MHSSPFRHNLPRTCAKRQQHHRCAVARQGQTAPCRASSDRVASCCLQKQRKRARSDEGEAEPRSRWWQMDRCAARAVLVREDSARIAQGLNHIRASCNIVDRLPQPTALDSARTDHKLHLRACDGRRGFVVAVVLCSDVSDFSATPRKPHSCFTYVPLVSNVDHTRWSRASRSRCCSTGTLVGSGHHVADQDQILQKAIHVFSHHNAAIQCAGQLKRRFLPVSCGEEWSDR